jgi:hypothetical protein
MRLDIPWIEIPRQNSYMAWIASWAVAMLWSGVEEERNELVASTSSYEKCRRGCDVSGFVY